MMQDVERKKNRLPVERARVGSGEVVKVPFLEMTGKEYSYSTPGSRPDRMTVVVKSSGAVVMKKGECCSVDGAGAARMGLYSIRTGSEASFEDGTRTVSFAASCPTAPTL